MFMADGVQLLWKTSQQTHVIICSWIDTGFLISMTIVRLSHHKVIPRYGVTILDMASVLLFVSTTPTYLSLNGTLDEFNNW